MDVPTPGDTVDPRKKKGRRRHWIAQAIQKPGALHAQLGVPQGQKIPKRKVRAAAGKGGKLGARARLAQTLSGMHR